MKNMMIGHNNKENIKVHWYRWDINLIVFIKNMRRSYRDQWIRNRYFHKIFVFSRRNMMNYIKKKINRNYKGKLRKSYSLKDKIMHCRICLTLILSQEFKSLNLWNQYNQQSIFLIRLNYLLKDKNKRWL